MNPYEEVISVIKALQDLKETIEGTDLEYFEIHELIELAHISDEISKLALRTANDIKNQD